MSSQKLNRESHERLCQEKNTGARRKEKKVFSFEEPLQRKETKSRREMKLEEQLKEACQVLQQLQKQLSTDNLKLWTPADFERKAKEE